MMGLLEVPKKVFRVLAGTGFHFEGSPEGSASVSIWWTLNDASSIFTQKCIISYHTLKCKDTQETIMINPKNALGNPGVGGGQKHFLGSLKNPEMCIKNEILISSCM